LASFSEFNDAAMGLRGWRLIGVAGTLFVYISGILFLSFVSLQTPHDRHPKGKVFGGDVSPKFFFSK
jgi:hypothetical protein